MAWVGEIGDHGWIAPVAHAGVAEAYLDSIRISVLDVPEGRGPTGTAVRERRHVFTTDIAKDARMGPWRDAALAREYRSSAAFPLVVEDRCVAVLSAYSSEPGFFDEEEVALFDRMVADLSFALEAMAREDAVGRPRRSFGPARSGFAWRPRRCSMRWRSSPRFAIVRARSSTFACGMSTTPAALCGVRPRAAARPSSRGAVSAVSRQRAVRGLSPGGCDRRAVPDRPGPAPDGLGGHGARLPGVRHGDRVDGRGAGGVGAGCHRAQAKRAGAATASGAARPGPRRSDRA